MKWGADCTVAIEGCSTQSPPAAYFVRTRPQPPDPARFPYGPNKHREKLVCVQRYLGTTFDVYYLLHACTKTTFCKPTNSPYSPSTATAPPAPTLRLSAKAPR